MADRVSQDPERDVGQPRGRDVGYIWSTPFVPSWTSSFTMSLSLNSPDHRRKARAKQGDRAVHPRMVDVGHWDKSGRLQKRPATKHHHWIPGRKFSVDGLSRIPGQANVTISPTSDHCGPACIGPGLELPASVAVPCGRKQGGPDRPLCQLSSSTTDEDDRLSFGSKPSRESGRSLVAGSTPPSSSPLTPLISTRTRPSTTKVDPAAMDGMWGTPPPPYKLNSALPTSTPPTRSRRYHVAEKNLDNLRQQQQQCLKSRLVPERGCAPGRGDP